MRREDPNHKALRFLDTDPEGLAIRHISEEKGSKSLFVLENCAR